MANNPREYFVIGLGDPTECRLSLLRHVFRKVRAEQDIACLYTPRLAVEVEVKGPSDRAASSIGAKQVFGTDLEGLLRDVVVDGAEEARLVPIASDGFDGLEFCRVSNVESVVRSVADEKRL